MPWLRTYKDKWQFVYNLVTFCIQFVLDLSCLCMEFVTTNTTRIFVICRNLDQKKYCRSTKWSTICLKFDKLARVSFVGFLVYDLAQYLPLKMSGEKHVLYFLHLWWLLCHHLWPWAYIFKFGLFEPTGRRLQLSKRLFCGKRKVSGHARRLPF